MRYLLLSVLVVCMIGIMVPTVLAESKIPTILILDPVGDSPLLSTVKSGEITFSGTLKTVGGSPVGDSIRFSSQIYIQGNIIDDGVIIDVIEVGNTGTNTEGRFFYKWTGVFDEFPQEKELTISFFAEYRGSKIFEPSTSQAYTVLFTNPIPSGIKYLGPLFEQDSDWTVVELYGEMVGDSASWENSERWFHATNIKIIRGDGKDLLVFDLLIQNKMNTPDGIRLDEVRMYDGKDRKFTPSVSYMITHGGKIKNTAFDWREDCPDNPFMEIQPEVKGKMKVCYEIPKDSDHFKVVSAGQLAVVFDRMSVGIEPFSVSSNIPNQEQPSMFIEPLYIIIGVVAIGGIIGAIAVARRGSKTPKPVKQKPKPVKQKPAKKKETSAFCENCGNTLNPKAKFCGSCGTSVP